VSVLDVGQAERFATEVPPVIEREAQERVRRYAALAEPVARAESVPDEGWFCPPTLMADLPDDSPVLSDEIFGPLLALTRVKSVDQACDIVDALPFALTGGLFSRSPATVERIRWATCT
jgi:RHH-type transcriptional regulator, proline utilization regulon repressor / proline dehydrogenase / delta 1-pyrroline-5-carboxylate dehydrogenase